MTLQDEIILRKHFTDLFEDSLDEDVDYIRKRIFDVIMSLGGLNALVSELINDTEWDKHTLKSLQEEYL
jgi:hypothetical protein